jgi:hypothetical protein
MTTQYDCDSIDIKYIVFVRFMFTYINVLWRRIVYDFRHCSVGVFYLYNYYTQVLEINKNVSFYFNKIMSRPCTQNKLGFKF